MSIVICQCGSAARSEPATDVMRLVEAGLVAAALALEVEVHAVERLGLEQRDRAPPTGWPAAVGDEVSASSELCPKSLTVSTTRSPAAWARVMRSARSWLWKPSQPGPLSSSVPSPFTPMEK